MILKCRKQEIPVISGLNFQSGISSRADVMQFCLELSEEKRVPLCLSFLVDILIEKIEKKVEVKVNFDFV